MIRRSAQLEAWAALPFVIACDADEPAPRDYAGAPAADELHDEDPEADPEAILVNFDQVWLHHVDDGWIAFTTTPGFANLMEPSTLDEELAAIVLPEGGFDRIVLHVTSAGVIVLGDIYVPLAVELVDRRGLVIDARFCVQGGDLQGLASDWAADERVHVAEGGWWIEGEIEVLSPPLCAEDFFVERPPPPPV